MSHRLIQHRSGKLRDTLYIHAFVPESKDRRPRRRSQFRKVVPGSDEWSRVRLFTSVIVPGDGASQCSPHSEGMRRRVFRTVGDVAAAERNGHEQPVAFTVCRDISTCLSSARGRSTHTQHVAIPEPTTVKYSRATDCRATREPRRARRWTIYRRVSAETERASCLRDSARREIIDHAVATFLPGVDNFCKGQ